MQAQVRGRVPLLTAALTVASLVVVFGAALQAGPTESLPAAPETVLAAIPTVNAGLSALAIGTITAGWRAIRRNDVERHRRLMLASFGLFVLFLALYLYRVALIGPTSFPGPATVERYVYYPVLAIHILLAVASLPLVYYALLLALTRPIRDLEQTRHAQIGRLAASLWLISFALGIVVYCMLYVVF
jgi:putative membrane protein